MSAIKTSGPLGLGVLALSILWGCSPQAFQSKAKTDTSSPSAEVEKNEDAEDETIAEPVMVGGSYLICMKDETIATSGADRVGVGCRIGDIEKKSNISDVLAASPIIIVSAQNRPESSPSVPAAAASPWHWTTDVPIAAINDLAPVLVEINGFNKPNIYRGALVLDPSMPVMIAKRFDDYLVAARSYIPPLTVNGNTQWNDETGARMSRSVPAPSYLSVVAGNAGNHTMTVSFGLTGRDDDIICEYKGGAGSSHPTTADEIRLGRFYELQKCLEDDDEVSPNAITADRVTAEVIAGDDQHQDDKTIVFIPLQFLP